MNKVNYLQLQHLHLHVCFFYNKQVTEGTESITACCSHYNFCKALAVAL